MVSRERITGLAIDALHAGRVEVSAAAHDDLLARHEEQLGLDLQLERLLCDATAALAGAGIAYRALKGPVLAHTVYGDPAARSFGDVDVLVPGPAFDAAIDTLTPLGFDRRFLEPRAGFDARFSKGACLERGDGMEIDLHRTLAPGPFGVMLAGSDLFARPPHRFSLGGHEIDAFDRELAFVHACFHAALGNDPPRLVPVRDVAEVLHAGVDATWISELATRVRCQAVLQRAVDLVDRELGIRLEGTLADWMRRYRPTRFDRWALRSYSSTHRSYGGQVAVSLWAMPSLRERVAYASALAFPTRDYVLARERGYGRRVRRSIGLVHEWRPR
jgi:hypothetical protein